MDHSKYHQQKLQKNPSRRAGKNITIAETNISDGITNNLVDKDCEEVVGIMTTLLNVSNTQQEETEDSTSDRPKEDILRMLPRRKSDI